MPSVASMLAYMSTGYDGGSMTARSSRVVIIVSQCRAQSLWQLRFTRIGLCYMHADVSYPHGLDLLPKVIKQMV